MLISAPLSRLIGMGGRGWGGGVLCWWVVLFWSGEFEVGLDRELVSFDGSRWVLVFASDLVDDLFVMALVHCIEFGL